MKSNQENCFHYDDFYFTEQILKNNSINFQSEPYDINFEIITEYIPLSNREELKPDHIIKILIEENEKILSLLKFIELNSKNLLKIGEFTHADFVLEKLEQLTESLIKTEIHHQKKENVFFPELEKRGIIGAVFLLKIENQEIRNYIFLLNSILKQVIDHNYVDSRKKINALTQALCIKFRANIKRENFIIFPLSLKIIKEMATWYKIKKECLGF